MGTPVPMPDLDEDGDDDKMPVPEPDEDDDKMPVPEPDEDGDGDDDKMPVPEPDEDGDGDDDKMPVPEPVPTPDETSNDFDAWVHKQEIPETDYFCYLEIHNEWQNGYNFFAGHDCTIYDLTLTVMARKSDWDEHLDEISSDAKEPGCQDIGTFDRACKFMLSPSNNKLGIKFDADADVDLYYETEWTNCLDNMLPAK